MPGRENAGDFLGGRTGGLLRLNYYNKGDEKMKNQTIEAVKRAIREPFAWPGGYPVYTIMQDGEMLCPSCAKGNFSAIVHATKTHDRSGWEAAGSDILWEGEGQCAHCGKILETAYGENENENDNGNL